MKKKHHSDPIVGGESEREGKRMGQGQFANMPTEVKMKAYPKVNEAHPPIDDTMGRLDSDEKDSYKKSKKTMGKGMY